MFGTPASNSDFDLPFLFLQAAGIVLWIFVVIFARRLPAWAPKAVAGAAFVLVVALPVFWHVRYPPFGGIEGAARLLVMIPTVGLNLILLVVSWFRVRRLMRSTAPR